MSTDNKEPTTIQPDDFEAREPVDGLDAVENADTEELHAIETPQVEEKRAAVAEEAKNVLPYDGGAHAAGL